VADVSNYNIENASGANVRSDLNNVFAAIQSSNSKSTDLAASQCVAGMPFLNTTSNVLKIRNSSNNAFTEIGSINQANLGLLPVAGGTMTGVLKLNNGNTPAAPKITFNGDTDTGFYRNGANNIGVATGGSEQMFFNANGISLRQENQLRYFDSDNSNYIGFKAPSNITSNFVLTLPATDSPVSGYALVSNGSGTLSWAEAAGGGGAVGGGNNEIFWENDQTVTQNYTITNGKNAGSFGPITIQSGVTVTVGSGETWTVV